MFPTTRASFVRALVSAPTLRIPPDPSEIYRPYARATRMRRLRARGRVVVSGASPPACNADGRSNQEIVVGDGLRNPVQAASGRRREGRAEGEGTGRAEGRSD